MRKPSKTEEEIRLGARPASTDEEVDHIRNMQKEFVSKYLKKMEEMTMTELKDVIKAAAMEEVEEEKIQKLSVSSEEMTTVAPVIEDAIDKVRHYQDGFTLQYLITNHRHLNLVKQAKEKVKKNLT